MMATTARTIQKTTTLTILQRIAGKDKTAVADCVEAYGNLIWALARQFTGSTEAAEAAAQEAFTDIWRSADRFADQPPTDERVLIALIARRRLIKYSQKFQPKSVANTDNQERAGAGAGRSSQIILRTSSGTKNAGDQTVNFLKRRRVLYAENNEDACLMVTTMLGLSDIEVITAGTVAEAWRLGQAEQFNLYLLDSRFPDGDGLELCRRLRSFIPHKPLLFYSGDAADDHRRAGLAAGADDYLTKPYLNDLALTIRQYIEQSEKSARQVATI